MSRNSYWQAACFSWQSLTVRVGNEQRSIRGHDDARRCIQLRLCRQSAVAREAPLTAAGDGVDTPILGDPPHAIVASVGDVGDRRARGSALPLLPACVGAAVWRTSP
jgi:hypothetical protein